MYKNSPMEPIRSVCPCFGGRSPVVIYDLTYPPINKNLPRNLTTPVSKPQNTDQRCALKYIDNIHEDRFKTTKLDRIFNMYRYHARISVAV